MSSDTEQALKDGGFAWIVDMGPADLLGLWGVLTEFVAIAGISEPGRDVASKLLALIECLHPPWRAAAELQARKHGGH